MSRAPADERENLAGAIADTEQALTRIAQEQAAHQLELADLKRRLAALNDRAAPIASPAPGTRMTPEDEVELFRSLLRGRVDVYPTRFVRKKDGLAGYAPTAETSSSRASATSRR